MPNDIEGLRSTGHNLIRATIPMTAFISGEYMKANRSNDRFIVNDPMTGTAIAELEEAGPSLVDEAVECASSALDNGVWSRVHPREREKALLRLAALIEDQVEDLALIEAVDTGKRLSGTRGWDIPNAAEVYRFYAGLCDKILGEYYPPVGSFRFHSQNEPLGTVAAVMPWNFPFSCLSWKVAPALAAGCSVVVKSAERAPLSTQLLGRFATEAGIPAGVVNVLPGRGATTGVYLVSNPGVRKITFTGSSQTAADIVRLSAAHFPRLTLELGGKSPNVIMADCDLDTAVLGTASAMFDVAGQNCLAGSRTFVHANIYDNFVERLQRLVGKKVLGDNLDERVDQGPQIDLAHVNRIDGFVSRAIGEGCSAVIGGKKSDVGDTFYEPTLLACPRDDMEVVREEVFGPIGCILKFSDLDEVIARANATEFGLAAAIWTSSTLSADHFATRVRAGTIWKNCYGMIDTVAPWGGFRRSGYGKELGRQAIEECLQTKVVYDKLV